MNIETESGLYNKERVHDSQVLVATDFEGIFIWTRTPAAEADGKALG